jgi:hypothetical protein
MAILTNAIVTAIFQILVFERFFSLARTLQCRKQHRHTAVQGRKTVRYANQTNEQTTQEDSVFKSTLITTVAALMLVTTLFLTAFASIEAAASPVRHDGDAGKIVSVRYLA